MAITNQEFAVIGLGRFGASLALELTRRGHTVLGIDTDALLVQEYADDLSQTVAMDASREDALQAVEIATIDTVVVAIGTDFESSVLVTVALKQLGVRQVICKAITEQQAEVLRRVGADRVILPEIEAGENLAQALATPRLLDSMVMGTGYSIAEVRVPARLAGKNLGDSNLRDTLNLVVLAVRSDDTNYLAPPHAYVLKAQDILVVLGPDKAIEKFSRDR